MCGVEVIMKKKKSKLREFFKLTPDKFKIFLGLILIAAICFLVLWNYLSTAMEAGVSWELLPEPKFYETITFIVSLLLFTPTIVIYWISTYGSMDPLITNLGLILDLVYWYFLACLISLIYHKLKKRKKKSKKKVKK
jgi:hypothetical protein